MSSSYPSPNEIPAVLEPYYGSFGKLEFEVSIACYIRACQVLRVWRLLSPEEIVEVCHNDKETLPALLCYSAEEIKEGFLSSSHDDTLVGFGWAMGTEGRFMLNLPNVITRLKNKGWILP